MAEHEQQTDQEQQGFGIRKKRSGMAGILTGILVFAVLLFLAEGLFVFQKLNRISYDSEQVQPDTAAM